MSPPLLVLTLSLLLGLQPVTTDLYLPAFPALTEELAAPMSLAQLTLGGMLLAFGASQLVWGPLSDRFGRRPILLVGLSAYVLASIGSAFATSMLQLVLWRIVQGAAMGAAVMCARAIVRDLFTPEAAARAMSKGLSGLGVIACMSAPLGGVATDLFGWRVALLLLGIFGATTLGVIALRFEETLREKNPRALQPRMMVTNWRHILVNRTFWSFTLLSTATYGGLFTFLAASSFVLIQIYGVAGSVYGLLMSSMSAAYLAGTVLCRRLIVRIGVRRTVAVGGCFSMLGGLGTGGLAFAGVHGVWAIMLPVYLLLLGHGIHQPCGQSGAVGPFPRTAGAASAMAGFLMMLGSFGMGTWLGASMDGTIFPMTNGILFWGIVTALVAWLLVWREADAPVDDESESRGKA